MKIVLIPIAFALFLLGAYSCKKQGSEGFKSLIAMETFASNQSCPQGGVIVKSGIDKNWNNVLDPTEVDDTEYVCNGENGQNGQNGGDKQIILNINYSANTTSTSPTIGGGLIKFNKNYYVGVDSIILVSNPYVGDASNTAILQLYNVTDNVPINNSQIITNNIPGGISYLQTGNLFNELPSKEITVGISIKSGTAGMFASSGSSYLILYRK